MSIAFTAVFATLIPAFVELVVVDHHARPVVDDDDNDDADDDNDDKQPPEGRPSESTTTTAAGKDWADEAVLDVAFYLRLHKFNDFDRR